MQYRNAKVINGGLIDCEINHPAYGWIPFTADPADTGAQFDVAALYAKMSADPALRAYSPPTLAELRAAKLSELAEVRWTRETAGVTYNGHTFATDGTSQTKIVGAVIGAQMDPAMSIKWKTVDGTFVTLSGSQIVAMGTAVRNHVQACFDREEALRGQIELASTRSSLAAIDIAIGWP